MKNRVLAMYDIRGIQNYIFRTNKLKDAIGASSIVENILVDALKCAIKEAQSEGHSFSYCYLWEDKTNNTYYQFDGDDKDVQVLYIGGGNAFFTFLNDTLCMLINKKMSRYVIEQTYSLQLAIATIEISDNYESDNEKIKKKMNHVKENMAEFNPIGALPVMGIELASGLPIDYGCKDPKSGELLSRETWQKRMMEAAKRKKIQSKNKILDALVEEKGVDSTIAVVHIDGNNMGLRIRELMRGEKDYVKAINKIRSISYNINHSFKDVFDSMVQYFNEKNSKEICMLQVINGGDDITYVCTGNVAIASVEYFVRLITKKTMTGNPNDVINYGFSICAGIAFIRSHFPFSVGYKVAEACCASAKERAKRESRGNKVGNYFDFQFCKNVQTQDIKQIRTNEYRSPSGEYLMRRPYEFGGEVRKPYSFEYLRRDLLFFSKLKEQGDGKNFPRSHAKTIRNTYSIGRAQMGILKSFLESRGWTLPGQTAGEIELYLENMEFDGETRTYTARYYDALELMDVYYDLEELEKSDLNDCKGADHAEV